MEATHESPFHVSADDFALIVKIKERAHKIVFRDFPEQTPLETLMDLCVAHRSCPLKLDELLVAPRTEFSHDIIGIYRHVDRKSLKLQDSFLPRYARANDG